MQKREPHYPLDVVKAAFAGGAFVTTRRVRQHMRKKRWDDGTVKSCVAALTRTDLHKSQQHEMRPDAWLDIYRPRVAGSRMYVKFTLHENGTEFLVLSFCIDGEDH